MLKNYLTTAFRNLWRSKGSTLINLSGLTIGVTASLILFLLVRHQSDFDHYHSNFDRIYRIVISSDGNQGRDHTPGVFPALPDAFKNDFHEAEQLVFTSYRADALVSIPQRTGDALKFQERKGVVYTEPEFFHMFDRKVLKGDASKALDDPNEAVISLASAKKYFGREDVIGEVVSFGGKDFKIGAVMEDTPNNTDLPFDLMLSYVTIKAEHVKSSGWNGIWSDEQCYFLLKKESHIAEVERRIPAFIKKYIGNNQNNTLIEMQPLSELHFDDRFGNYNYNTTSRQMLMALSVIGILLIITACINFINLVTAEAIKRSKEVGIRKTMGSSRLQLIFQFLGESSLITLFAVLLAVAMTQVGLSFLNPFLDLKLGQNFFADAGVWTFLISVTAVVALLSGLYPSLVVSAFRPAFAIKNQINTKNSSGYHLRRGLVILQFAISQLLIIGTIVLVRQMDYFKNKDLGFRRDAIITVPIPEKEQPASVDHSSKMRTLREEVSQLRGIELASLSNTPPSSGSVQGTDFQIAGKEEHFGTQVKAIDGHYLDLYDLKLVSGANVLDLDTAQGFLVNEKLATMVGFTNPRDMVGTIIKMWGKTLPVIGVVRNFHTVSLHDPVEATIMLNRIRNYETLSLRINPGEVQKTIKEVQQRWEAAYPAFIFSYQFMDDQIKEFYAREQKVSVLFALFASLAIFIGCLGLFGLASFMANQKTKEIGVRKVMGASVQSIIGLFSREFVILIVVGFAVASPVAWYVFNQWLDQFAYKIDIGPVIFATGLLVTIVIAVITVGYRSFRAATANPIDSLKYE